MSRPRSAETRMSSASAALRGSLWSVAVLSLFVNLLFLTGPMFMLQVYDRVLTSRSIPTLIVLAALVVVLYGFLFALDTTRGRILVRIAQRFDAQVSADAFARAMSLPLTMGRRGERVEPVRDLDEVRQFLGGGGFSALFDLPWIPIYLGVVFMLHPVLGLVGTMATLVLAGFMVLNEFLVRGPTGELSRMGAARGARVFAARANAEVVAAMGMESNLQRAWLADNRAYLEAQRLAVDRTGMIGSATKTIRYIIQSAVLGVGAYLAIRQAITPGAMIAASIIAARALSPVEQAVGHWRGFVSARQCYKRLGVALKGVPAGDEVRTELPPPSRTLTVSGLAVAPPGERKPTVAGIKFNLKAGDGLGIIGPSGSGKSSLARALAGIWQPAAGSVRLDGADFGQWQRDVLGRSIGYLPQEIELFDGTVAANISRFGPDASDEDIIDAARRANAHELITRLEQGYDTPVGEFGTTLSAGQRQRIALARALYGSPFLVVLDEPNSNLDIDGEKALTAAIAGARAAGAILIVVAHRPSAIAAVDFLLRIENGRQVDLGPKKDVIERLNAAAKAGASNVQVMADAGR